MYCRKGKSRSLEQNGQNKSKDKYLYLQEIVRKKAKLSKFFFIDGQYIYLPLLKQPQKRNF